MIDISRDIHSLTDFKKNTSDFIDQLKQTGEPVVLTINPHDAQLLEVDAGLPLLLLSRHAYDVTGEPVEWALSWYRGDRYKFVTRLRR